MSSWSNSAYEQYEIVKYKNLNRPGGSSTSNILLTHSIPRKEFSIFIQGNIIEKINYSVNNNGYPSFMYRDNYLVVLLNANSQGFRVSFKRVQERESFTSIIEKFSANCRENAKGSSQRSSVNSCFSTPASSASSRFEQFGSQFSLSNDTELIRDQLTQKSSGSQCSLKSQYLSTYSGLSNSNLDSSYSLSPYTAFSQEQFSQKYQNTPTKNSKFDKACQTEDLANVMMKDKILVNKFLGEMMNNELFMGLVKTFKNEITTNYPIYKRAINDNQTGTAPKRKCAVNLCKIVDDDEVEVMEQTGAVDESRSFTMTQSRVRSSDELSIPSSSQSFMSLPVKLNKSKRGFGSQQLKRVYPIETIDD